MTNFREICTSRAILILALISIGSVKVKAQAPMLSPMLSPMMSPMMSPAAAPGPGTGMPDCMTLVYNMTDCLTFVEKGSTERKPDKACCPELAGMLDTNPLCLCLLFGNTSALPVELDINKALNLPKVCGLTTPPISMCSLAGISIGAPMGVPVGAPSSTEGPSSFSSGAMSPIAGEPSPGKNGASNAYFSLVYLIAGLALALSLSSL